MAWRPNNENSGRGYPRLSYSHPHPHAQHFHQHNQFHQNHGRSRGRGFVPNQFGFPRGYGRGISPMSQITEPHGFGRGRFPLFIPQPQSQDFHQHHAADNSIYNNNTFYAPSTMAMPNTSYYTPHYVADESMSQYETQSKMYNPEDRNHNSDEKSKGNVDSDSLQHIWDDARYPDKKDRFAALFEKLALILKPRSNPWKYALFLIKSASDYELSKTASLSYQILWQFEKWVNSSHNVHAGNEEKFLSQEFRVEVFYATSGQHISFFHTAVSAFHLCHPGNEYFLPMLKSLLHRDKLTEVPIVVSKLGLQAHFSRDEIMVPLLLTDRINLLEQYIRGDSQQQMLLLDLLDHLCARNTDIVSFAQSTGLKNIKGEKLNKKCISKLATRIMKMFDIPSEMCPNISDSRAMSAVRFLLYKHYIEKSMTAECWDDMVESVIGENTSLQQQFILELMSYNDAKEAVKWVNRYHLPDSALDPSVVEAKKTIGVSKPQATTDQEAKPSVNSGKNESKPELEENWDTEITSHRQTADVSCYYSIPLKDEDIVLVDTRDKLMTALERLTKPSTAIGIDCEWKPISASKQVALLQLAVSDAVFLVDFVQLEGLVSPQDWKHFAQSMFCNQHVIKIGYSLDTDLRMLCNSYPSMKDALVKMVRVIELSSLARKVNTVEEIEKTSKNGCGHSSSNQINKGTVDVSDDYKSNSKTDGDSDSDGSKEKSSNQNVTFGRGFKTTKTEEKGLSLLVKQLIGKPLCKDEQMSNWEKRPLRRSQILYAAMDAYVLLEIHNKLLVQGKRLGIYGDELEPPVFFKAHSRLDKKKHKMTDQRKKPSSQSSNNKFPHSSRSCRPHELRVVCDSMLQGLGNQLRSCGVDTLILSTGQVHDDAVQIALRENRIILTTGLPYEQVRGRVGDSMCYCVSHTLKAKDQCIDVLKHFKVEVELDDIFSRCAVCNGSEFSHIPTLDMERLYIVHLQHNTDNNSVGSGGSSNQHQQHAAARSSSSSSLASSSSSSMRYSGYGRSMTAPGSALVDGDTMHWFSTKYGIDVNTVTFLHNSVRIQVETIPSLKSLQTIGLFFICVGCGKVYWKGSHYKHIQEQFQPVFSLGHQPQQQQQQQQQPADVVEVTNDDMDDGVDYNSDCDAVNGELSNLDLKEAGFSGAWKIS